MYIHSRVECIAQQKDPGWPNSDQLRENPNTGARFLNFRLRGRQANTDVCPYSVGDEDDATDYHLTRKGMLIAYVARTWCRKAMGCYTGQNT